MMSDSSLAGRVRRAGTLQLSITGRFPLFSEFELQGIKARLLGGQRSAAARGALKMLLPIGLAYDHNDEVAFDPDRSIVDAIGQVFESFRRRGSAMAVVKWMHRENIALPSRPRTGPTRGELRWALPSFAQVGRILRNPRYAGAFVYGRNRIQRRGDGTGRVRVVPMGEWEVCIPDAHVGFIDWEEYRRNQATMASNARAFLGSESRTAAPREGSALLQSRVLCGHCGRRMSPTYTNARPSRDAPACYHYVCKEPLVRYGRKTCQSVRGDLVDAGISRFVIDVMNRKNIDLALAVQEQVGAEFAEADAQRARRIEGIRYEADLARRRFF
ncbi:MAG: recombinase family protein, partial [Thiotrichales bacterium]|nr:recombinase family protein [Thiotrichales bacterium]